MPIPSPTVEELVAALRHSSLPTVLVEGPEDIRIYRWVEARLGSRTANVLPTGGRENLLSIYMKRHEFADLPVAFVADRDMWLFSGIPPNYDEVIWTEGYSVENDLYAGAELENLLDAEEAQAQQQLLDAIAEWFAFEVEEHLAERHYEVSHHCDRVVPRGHTQIDEDFRKNRGFRHPEERTYRQIKREYRLQLRGKQLFQILERFLNASNRGTRYNVASLQEIALKMTPAHPLMSRLMQEIEQTVADQKSAP
ncbi:MAG: DUF4435 domain-containing protein [Caldilineaceae bacterium]|nr:DUF4435 domain-containing protein [Caldilineaceae bacterium]MDE0336157.1 DUF4435 domain-containing protein [Caldilineaceae bacterium]